MLDANVMHCCRRINYELLFSSLLARLQRAPPYRVIKGMANDNNSSANSMLRCQRKIIVIYRPNGVISKQTEIVATRFFCLFSRRRQTSTRTTLKTSRSSRIPIAMKFMATWHDRFSHLSSFFCRFLLSKS